MSTHRGRGYAGLLPLSGRTEGMGAPRGANVLVGLAEGHDALSISRMINRGVRLHASYRSYDRDVRDACGLISSAW